MRRYETPTAIASALARYRPRKIERILDPAVGNGILLEPFSRHFANSNCEVYAIDSDSRPLRKVEQKFLPLVGKKLKVFQADFLKWACGFGNQKKGLFDCIVMNPPFVGKRQNWKPLEEVGNLANLNSIPKTGPVEAGFIVAAISLLRHGGRMLAVLPASVMTSQDVGWAREFMTANGAIRHVHELPRFAFPKIESRIYLVVFEKGPRRKETLLLNHDLDEPEKMIITKDKKNWSQRLDFGYHNAAMRAAALKRQQALGWQELGELAAVWRGTEKTPGLHKSVIHTGHYQRGFWRTDENCSLKSGLSSERKVQAGDILVKRVSRNCARSFGLGVEIENARASDCVLVIRPRRGFQHLRLLFAVRCLMAFDYGPLLLERGTGASYITQREIAGLEVPYWLSKLYPGLYKLYVKAVQRRSFASMQDLESRVCANLQARVSS